MAIILIAIGLLFTGLDFHIVSGIFYPTYVEPHGTYLGVEMSQGIQTNVTKHILGNQLQIDILPDFVGCVLLIIGLAMLVKHNKKYVGCVILTIITACLSLAIRIVPFYINSAALIVTTLAIFALIPIFEIWMEYKILYTTVGISDDMVNQSTNKRMQFCWWITVFARVFMVFLTFSGLTRVKRWYEVVLTVFVFLYLYQLIQTRKYVGTFKVYKEGFTSSILPEYIQEKIRDVSFQENRDISMNELRYIKVMYFDFKGQIREGELIVNQKIAYQTMRIFYQLYKIEYPIEKINLVDEYEADDQLSMEDNNSSAFNYRMIEGTQKLSNHALGFAIDINPQMNPYVRENEFFPANGKEYLERDLDKCLGAHKDKMIHKNDMAYKIFRRNGFEWGGEWTHAKDYQHFQCIPKKR